MDRVGRIRWGRRRGRPHRGHHRVQERAAKAARGIATARDVLYRLQERLRLATLDCIWRLPTEGDSVILPDHRVLISGYLRGSDWALITRSIRLFERLEFRIVEGELVSRAEFREAYEDLTLARGALSRVEPRIGRWQAKQDTSRLTPDFGPGLVGLQKYDPQGESSDLAGAT